VNIHKLFNKIKNNISYIKLFNYFKYIFLAICFIYLMYQSLKDFNQVKKIIISDYKIFFLIFILTTLNLNLMNYRFYYFLRKLTNYSGNYLSWSKLFFQTVIMNFFLGGTGHLLRAIQLKKENLNYTEFITLNYVVYLLIFTVNFFLFLNFFYIITKEKVFILFSITIFLFLFIFIQIKFYKFFLNIIKKKVKFLKKYKKIILNALYYCSNYFSYKKNLIIFSFLTLKIFLLEGVIIYFICSNILVNETFYEILIVFFIVFHLNKILHLNNFIGLNELIMGLVAETLGFYFLQGALIQLIFRLNIYLGSLLNSVFYYFIAKKIIRKNIV